MANTDAPTGFRPIGHLLGLDWSAALRRCYIPSTDSTRAFFIGDLVDLAGSASTDGAYATVTTGSAGLATYPIFGVINSFEPDPTDLTLLYRKDDTARYCQVVVDPFVIFEAQGDTVAVIPYTSVGLNVCMIATHSGSTTTGLSGEEIDSDGSNPASDATFPFLLMGAVDRPFNDVTLVNAKWHVMITMHRLLPNYSNTAYFGAKGV